MQVEMRTMRPSHADAILRLRAACYDWKWTPGNLAWLQRQRNVHIHVALSGFWVVGYMVHSTGKNRLAVVDMAVRPDLQRRGIGSQMLAWILGRMRDGRANCFAPAQESNLGAQLFLRAAGWRCIKVSRPSFFPDGQRAYIFHMSLLGNRFQVPVQPRRAA